MEGLEHGGHVLVEGGREVLDDPADLLPPRRTTQDGTFLTPYFSQRPALSVRVSLSTVATVTLILSFVTHVMILLKTGMLYWQSLHHGPWNAMSSSSPASLIFFSAEAVGSYQSFVSYSGAEMGLKGICRRSRFSPTILL